jgi:signal transduction histidine kinase
MRLPVKWMHTVRWKFLFSGLMSAVITAGFLYMCNFLIVLLIKEPGFQQPISRIINEIGSLPFFIAGGFSFYVICFFLLTRGTVRRLENMNLSIRRIGEGDFDNGPPSLSSSDEIGQIETSIHKLGNQLRDDLTKIFVGLRHIAEGKFDQPIQTDENSGELTKVANSINHMATELHRSIMEERNAEKSKNDLITGVSHDLRTPLTSILGFLEVIDHDRYQNEVELRHYVSIAYDKALTLKKSIDDLFEYTRINNGMPLNTAILDLVGFIRQLSEEFAPQFDLAEMTCRIHVDVEVLQIAADGNLLVRSFENLISNALQYGKSGRVVDIAIQSSDKEAIVSMTNYGEPIPQRDLPFIFDRFYRVERSRSRDTGGTGLGLAIVKSIIEVHGGRISVDSSEERTVFTTRLPTLT